MTTILSGLRTNSEYHIGNYLGAILPMKRIADNLSAKDSLYLFLPDLHSLEMSNKKTNSENTLENTRIFLACGIRPKHNVYLYRQSQISAHSELQWILNWYTHMGEANRMIQFKDKSKQSGTAIPVSLFTYPILQAADILLYDAEIIPVGEDQRQHIELTRTIAMRFNNKHGKVFTPPKTWKSQLSFTGRNEGLRIRSLTDPTKKMSKSDDNPASYILLSDSPSVASKKIMSATTDSVGMIDWNWETQPGITNLLQLLASFSNKTQDEVTAEWQGKTRYGDLKKAVADEVSRFLTELQISINTIDFKTVTIILNGCEKQVRQKAQEKLMKVHTALGLI